MADDVKTKTSQDQQQQIVIPNGDSSKQAMMNDANNVADADTDADAKADGPEAAAEASVNGLNVVISSAVTNNIAIASHPSSNQPSDDDAIDDDDDDDVENDDDGDAGTVTHTENGHAPSRSNSSSSSCFSTTSSSTVSSRLSTPPPTGEDDSTPVSPSKTLQAQLVAANLNALSQGKATTQKQRCKSCLQVRKTSSLKGPQELNGCRTGNDATLCNSTPAISHQHHHSHNHNHSHSHSHHHHHSHAHAHSHHNHHHSHNLQQHHQLHHHSIIGGGIGSASIGGSGLISLSTESDKIPKIVGKLGNLDGLTFTNGHGLPFNYPQQQQQQLPQQQQHHHLLARRHSETNSLTADKWSGSVISLTVIWK